MTAYERALRRELAEHRRRVAELERVLLDLERARAV